MRLHEVERDEVADPLVERGRALQVGEQEGEAGDLQALVDVERVGPVDVAEGLVGEQALRGQERLAPAEQLVQRVAGDPHGRAARGASVRFSSGKAKRPGPQLERAGRRMDRG